MLKVIVSNPADLARQRGALIGAAAQLAPELIRQAVDAEIARQLRTQLKAQGVQAEVFIEPNPATTSTAALKRWVICGGTALLLLGVGAALALLAT